MILRAIVKRHNIGTNGPAALTGRPEIPGSIPGSPFFASVVQKQDARMTPVRCGAGQDLESRGASPRSWHQFPTAHKAAGRAVPGGTFINPAGEVVGVRHLPVREARLDSTPAAPISAGECPLRKPLGGVRTPHGQAVCSLVRGMSESRAVKVVRIIEKRANFRKDGALASRYGTSATSQRFMRAYFMNLAFKG